jgi:hypothetical protein
MTTAKLVRVSDDAQSTWNTLPGGTGEWNDDADQITDTIFGQTYESSEVGLITWTANANALYKGFAGYVAKIKSPGTPTAVTGEAMTLVSGKTFRIDDATKEVWDRSVPIVVFDIASDETAEVESVDYLFGQVTFLASYTVLGAITVDVTYLPMATIAKASSFTLTQTVAPIDESDFDTSQANGGYRVFQPGLRTVSLDIGGFYDSTNDFFTVIAARDELVIEINPDGSGLSMARGFFKMTTRGQSGDVGALEEESITFSLNVPASGPPGITNIAFPFNWDHDPVTTLSAAIQICLTAFIDETIIDVSYAPEGLGQLGYDGTVVVTDVSLSSGLDAMNEFTANFQGSGAPTRQSQTA